MFEKPPDCSYTGKTVIAHCVYSGKKELELIKKNKVFIAHCSASNMNLSSGIAPIRRYLDMGISVGLGSDVAVGQTESIFRAMTDAMQVSGLNYKGYRKANPKFKRT